MALHKSKVNVKHPDDVVIVCAIRTAITKGKRGPLRDTQAETLFQKILEGVIKKTGIKPELVEDIHVGNTIKQSIGAMEFRMAALAAGFPETTSLAATNRACSSGLQATHYIAAAIATGTIEIGIGAGVESMSNGYGDRAPAVVSEKILRANPVVADALIPMGITSENVAADFNISRQKQDEFSVMSHKKAAAAQKAGYFKEEIWPIEVEMMQSDGSKKRVVVADDDGIRADTTLEGLSKLKPAFKAGGSTTAGNASQVSDGAAAVLMMKRKKAQELGLPVLATFAAFATIGVPPRVMGIGPAYAIPKVLAHAGLTKDDIDIFEINEAFASQAVYSIDKLGLDYSKVNPKGGAIAIGHPLGCTGARQIATIIPELRRQGKKIGVTSMCMGGGMGGANHSIKIEEDSDRSQLIITLSSSVVLSLTIDNLEVYPYSNIEVAVDDGNSQSHLATNGEEPSEEDENDLIMFAAPTKKTKPNYSPNDRALQKMADLAFNESFVMSNTQIGKSCVASIIPVPSLVDARVLTKEIVQTMDLVDDSLWIVLLLFDEEITPRVYS
ncbi:hypothetical protein SmJEL517_g05926 [Synchytrium microbalum]|uniref:acetyl-CoA C-acyltransferase n=1 Tax=Synchytrium microbalum TaxID=1806994 RepID=A0A507BTD0_9FUNG|nr:uncharacterized protein SmJEL517_g05926 [Synchytrium microbalum]TPX30541.1 hypothetical protein SmJEL517_g05926 [Synchytrium microbalum]